jgi:hypothetical protein
MPDYNKNWLWRGDNLWYQRWMQVWYLQPEFFEIISWNDFGESHYIGPLDDRQYSPFVTGKAPFNYAKDMPHDGWRDLGYCSCTRDETQKSMHCMCSVTDDL